MAKSPKDESSLEQKRIDAAVALDEKNRLQAEFNELVLNGADPESKRGQLLIANAKAKMDLVKRIESNVAIIKDCKSLEKNKGYDCSDEIAQYKEEELQLREKYWTIPEYGYLKGEEGAFKEREVSRPKLTVDFMLARAIEKFQVCLVVMREKEKELGEKPIKLDSLLANYFRKRRENIFVSEELSFLDIELRRYNVKLDAAKKLPDVTKEHNGRGRPPVPKSEKIADLQAKIDEIEAEIKEREAELTGGEKVYRAFVLERRKLKDLKALSKKDKSKSLKEEINAVESKANKLQAMLNKMRAQRRKELDELEPAPIVDSVLLKYNQKLIDEISADDIEAVSVLSEEKTAGETIAPEKGRRVGIQVLQ